MDVVSQAKNYAARGWSVVPIAAGSKGPTRSGWQHLRLSEGEIDDLFHGGENVGIILGEASGGLLNIDLDCVEAVALANDYLPPTPCVSGRSGRPGAHRWYKCSDCTPKQYRDPLDKSSIVEIRGNGQQTVAGPSRHPSGDVYAVVPEAEPATVERCDIEAAVEKLWEAVVRHRGHELPKVTQPPVFTAPARGPVSLEDRALAYLDAMPPAIQGQNGSGALYAAATSLVHGFELNEELALLILMERYNPRCVPPWTEAEIRHKVEEAANKPHSQPRGWLANQASPQDAARAAVDLSGLLAMSVPRAATPTPAAAHEEVTIPRHLFESVPGFIRSVMDLTLRTAPYPNVPLAFSGALCLQAFLAGRKVADPEDGRTNMFALALAQSGAGKDHPRKVNFKILGEAGITAYGDRVASGESLHDSLFATPCMLLQTDEIDEMFQNLKMGAESRYASWQKIIMTLWSSANSEVPMRLKSGKDHAVLVQPHLVLMGTAVPNHFFDSLSESQLTSGLVSRMLIIEADPRGEGQTASPVKPPAEIIDVAKWWRDYSPGGDLQAVNPSPREVQYTEAAAKCRDAARKEFGKLWDAGGDTEKAVWSRACEQAQRMALCYACSENHESPQVTSTAIEWAIEFMRAHAKRLLHLAAKRVTDNPWDKTAKKVLRKIEDAILIDHSALLRMMNMPSKALKDIVETLIVSERIRAVKENDRVCYEVVR